MEKLKGEILREFKIKENTKKFFYGQLRMLLTSKTTTCEEIDEIEKFSYLEKGEGYQIICTNYRMTDNWINENFFFFPDIDGSNVIFISSENAKELVRKTLLGYGIGVSEVHYGLGNLRVAFHEAMEQRIRTFCMLEKKEEGKVKRCSISLNELECFAQRIGTPHSKENNDYLKKMVDYVKNQDMEGKRFQETIRQLINRVKDIYGGILLTEGIPIEMLYAMLAFKNIDSYYAEMYTIFSKLHQKVSNVRIDYRDNKQLEQSLAYIKENYKKNIDMAIVSNQVSMNYTVFSSAFKEYTGRNFIYYVRDIRLSEAKKLLVETNQKIKRISSMVGYKDEKHFMKIFKSAVGVTPSEYRKNAWIKGQHKNMTP